MAAWGQSSPKYQKSNILADIVAEKGAKESPVEESFFLERIKIRDICLMKKARNFQEIGDI